MDSPATLADPGARIDPPETEELAELCSQFENAEPQETLRWALERYGRRLAISSAFGAEGMVALHMAVNIDPTVRAFTLDTGFLFPESVAMRGRVLEALGVEVEVFEPKLSVEQQAEEHGPELYARDPDQCCFMRKVEPLQRALATVDAWATGLRRDQAPTRAKTQALERVRQKDGRILLKVNPLHDRGYPSIGCVPCTRPVAAGENERSGRWAGTSKVECGIHTALERV